MALNSISLYGRFTKDVELRNTQSGKKVASFSLAVDRDGKDAGTDFINCVAWNGTAEFVSKYFSKGSAAVVLGRLQTRSYEDKDGNKRSATEVVAYSVYFGGDKKSANTESASNAPFVEITEEEEDGDTLPF